MELVLGIDNIVFIAILSSRLPPAQQSRARRLGLGLALGTRLGLLFSVTWIMGLTRPLFVIGGQAVSARDLVLIRRPCRRMHLGLLFSIQALAFRL